ncbi:MAG: plasma-membrane proton-efflux P-type ATPase [Chlamydiota bacterium]
MQRKAISEEKLKELSSDDLLQALDTNAQTGLTADEARKRLQEYGPNSLASKSISPIYKFLSYFWGPIPWMIEIAALLSVLVRHWEEFVIIMVLLIFNAVIGFWEEHKAENALAALKKGLALNARVLRGGEWKNIPAAELVPGDVIRIRLGDIIPADVKLFEGEYVNIDQSALTGESLPVSKKTGEIGYSGSVVKKGEMISVVANTGENTFFGRTAKLVASAGSSSHFQKAVMRIGDFLIFMALFLSFILISVELHRGEDALELIQFVLILVIASIPVAMPAVLSVTMALGALLLSKKKAIVSRLQAIEELAGVDILCTDKTGTLTKNILTLDRPYLFASNNDEECILAGSLASKEEDNDPIDLAIINSLKDKNVLSNYEQKHFVPFDPISKRTESTIVDNTGKERKYSKGAPQVIVQLCSLDTENKEKVDQVVNDYASKGYRTLGVAATNEQGNWVFLGILPLFDPPRDDSKQTIADAIDLGISVKMVTGDNTAIAREMSRKLNMGTNIRSVTGIFPEGANFDHYTTQIADQVESAEGFAEVYPEHKYGIVKALQEKDHIVMMTGDGVNDAPALKQADAGIAVSGATDAARAAAALILTAPGLSVIISAIKEARCIFMRMLSYTIYRIAMTFDIMLFVVLTMLLFPIVGGESYQPLTPFMIVLLALLDDIPIMTIAYDNTVISSKPVRWQMGWVLSISTVFGIMAVIQTFGLFLLGIHWINTPEWQNWIQIDPEHLQTIIFLQLVVGGHLLLFLTRSRKPFFYKPFPSKILFSAIVGTQILAMFICAYGWFVPSIPWMLIGLVWAYNLIWMIIQDIIKLIAYKIIDLKAAHHLKYFDLTHRELHPFQSQANSKREV